MCCIWAWQEVNRDFSDIVSTCVLTTRQSISSFYMMSHDVFGVKSRKEHRANARRGRELWPFQLKWLLPSFSCWIMLPGWVMFLDPCKDQWFIPALNQARRPPLSHLCLPVCTDPVSSSDCPSPCLFCPHTEASLHPWEVNFVNGRRHESLGPQGVTVFMDQTSLVIYKH